MTLVRTKQLLSSCLPVHVSGTIILLDAIEPEILGVSNKIVDEEMLK
jgi:hypothetical protein